MQDKALQSEKMQDNPAKSRTVGNSGYSTVMYDVGTALLKSSSIDTAVCFKRGFYKMDGRQTSTEAEYK